MSWKGTNGKIYPDGVGPSCECGERALTPIEEDADRCELCDRDRESILALSYAKKRHSSK